MVTRLADVIQPDIFTPYAVQRTMELSALVQSGIVQNDSEFDRLAGESNTLVNLPFWNDLQGESQLIGDTGDFSANKITSGKDVARKQFRGNMWGANGLSALLSGADPMKAIADLVAAYWTRDMQTTLLSTLDGAFAAASMAGNVHDISAEVDPINHLIGASTFIDCEQKLGDAKGQLTGVMMHSAVEAYLAKKDLIDYEKDSEGGTRVPFYKEKRVIVDDAMAYDSGTKVAAAYLFGPGAIALGNGSHPRIIPTEVDRNKQSKSGEEFLINRRIFILHPRGIKWLETSVAGDTPSNVELETGTNWERTYEPKAIRTIKFIFRIG